MNYLRQELPDNELQELFKPGQGFRLANCIRSGCTDKPRFQIYKAKDPIYADPLAWRAIQGHTKSCATIVGMGWQQIGLETCTSIWHGTKRSCTDSILSGGLIPGGAPGKGRSEIFFSPRHPLIQGSAMDSVRAYKFDAEIYIEVDVKSAIASGCAFFLSEGGAVLCREIVSPQCLTRIVDKHNHPIWTGAKITSHFPFNSEPLPFKEPSTAVLVAPPPPPPKVEPAGPVTNAVGDRVRDYKFAMQEGFFWAGHVRCGVCPVYSDFYPNGRKTKYALERKRYTGEITLIKLSDDENTLVVTFRGTKVGSTCGVDLTKVVGGLPEDHGLSS